MDWVVPSDAEVGDAIVFATFEDAAGNFAEGTAAERITINAPPTAVTLNPVTNVEASSVDLTWSQNQNADFRIVLSAAVPEVLRVELRPFRRR